MAWSWYTKGRRIPTLIGKDVSGRRIPGGPYTGLQAVTAAAVPALLWSTRGLWAAEMAGLAMFAVLVGVTVAAVKMVGKVDFASRNPLLLLGGYLRQTSRLAGTLAGRKLAEPKPHRVACTIDVTHASLEDLEAADSANRQGPATADRAPVTAAAAPDLSTPDVDVAEAALPVVEAAASDPAPVVEAAVSVPPVRSTKQPAPVAAAMRPAAPLAPDRRRSGLEAFLAGAAAGRDAPINEEDAA